MCVASGRKAKKASCDPSGDQTGLPTRAPEGDFTRTVRFSIGKKRSKASELRHPQVAGAARDGIEGHLGEVHAGAAEPFERRQAVAAGDEELPAVGAEVGQRDDLGPRREDRVHDGLGRREVGLLGQNGHFAGHCLRHRAAEVAHLAHRSRHRCLVLAPRRGEETQHRKNTTQARQSTNESMNPPHGSTSMIEWESVPPLDRPRGGASMR